MREQMEERKFVRARNYRARGQANEQEWLKKRAQEKANKIEFGQAIANENRTWRK
ncbi:3185_t:CDS:2 [Ambispora leptoticha]|uniref:3185_t:CDS:1 n=1 Tax=Ambispora leptoticha TaxID=144679 RepID=A0A9N9BHX6_9GLOM|nr:3185_t:CDS:2 [Ambispora leptoticha]